MPRGRPRRFWATGRPARLRLIAVPGGIEDYFRQINAAASDNECHWSLSAMASASPPNEPTRPPPSPGPGLTPGFQHDDPLPAQP